MRVIAYTINGVNQRILARDPTTTTVGNFKEEVSSTLNIRGKELQFMNNNRLILDDKLLVSQTSFSGNPDSINILVAAKITLIVEGNLYQFLARPEDTLQQLFSSFIDKSSSYFYQAECYRQLYDLSTTVEELHAKCNYRDLLISLIVEDIEICADLFIYNQEMTNITVKLRGRVRDIENTMRKLKPEWRDVKILHMGTPSGWRTSYLSHPRTQLQNCKIHWYQF
jgi:hypothetical protein